MRSISFRARLLAKLAPENQRAANKVALAALCSLQLAACNRNRNRNRALKWRTLAQGGKANRQRQPENRAQFAFQLQINPLESSIAIAWPLLLGAAGLLQRSRSPLDFVAALAHDNKPQACFRARLPLERRPSVAEQN